MPDPLSAWRAEFPIVETCTYLVSHSLGAMPRRAADVPAAVRRRVVDARRARVARGLVGDRTDDRRSARADCRRAAGHDLHAPERHASRRRSSRPATDSTARAAGSSWRSRVSRPTCISSKGSAATARRSSYVRSDDGIRTNLDRLLDAIDERTVLVPVSLVLFKSAFIENAAAMIEKAHRVGARVILDIYQAAGTVPFDLTALGVDFAVGGSVKWLCGGPGAGYLYVRPDLARDARARHRRMGGARAPVRVRGRRHRYADAPGAFSERHAERARAVCVPRRLRDRSRDRCRRDPRQSSALTRRLIDLARRGGVQYQHARRPITNAAAR